jgi:hypothetical protein
MTKVTIYHPDTGDAEDHLPLNARDLVNHSGWTFDKPIIKTIQAETPVAALDKPTDDTTSTSTDTSAPGASDVNGGAGADDGATGGSSTPTATVVTNTDDADGTDDADDADDADDEDDAATLEGLGAGIVRDSTGELVDDALLAALKGLNKTALIAYAKEHYGITVDGRKTEDTIRLAIYDQDRAKSA